MPRCWQWHPPPDLHHWHAPGPVITPTTPFANPAAAFAGLASGPFPLCILARGPHFRSAETCANRAWRIAGDSDRNLDTKPSRSLLNPRPQARGRSMRVRFPESALKRRARGTCPQWPRVSEPKPSQPIVGFVEGRGSGSRPASNRPRGPPRPSTVDYFIRIPRGFVSRSLSASREPLARPAPSPLHAVPTRSPIRVHAGALGRAGRLVMINVNVRLGSAAHRRALWNVPASRRRLHSAIALAPAGQNYETTGTCIMARIRLARTALPSFKGPHSERAGFARIQEGCVRVAHALAYMALFRMLGCKCGAQVRELQRFEEPAGGIRIRETRLALARC
jgi:hypothetical protein